MKPISCKVSTPSSPTGSCSLKLQVYIKSVGKGKQLSSFPLIKSLLLIVFIQQIFIIEHLQGHSAGKALEQRKTGEPCRKPAAAQPKNF